MSLFTVHFTFFGMSEVFYIGKRHIRVEKLNRKHKVENESTCKNNSPNMKWKNNNLNRTRQR